MITNLFIAYVVFTNTFATNITDNLRLDTVYKFITYSQTIEGELIQGTNRTELGRHWMQHATNFVQLPSGLFQKVEAWIEVPPPIRATMVPPMPPPPPLPGGVSTNVPSYPGYIITTNYTGPRVPP